MVGSRFEQLVRLFSALAPAFTGGCVDRVDDGSGIDASLFDESVCEGEALRVLAGVRPTEPVDASELRDAVISEYGHQVQSTAVRDAFGVLCSGATDVERCQEELDLLPPQSELTEDWAQRSLLFTRADEIGRVTSLAGLEQFVGEVDTVHDAALLLLGRFHQPVCDGSGNAVEVEDGYRLRTHALGQPCQHSRYEHVVSVTADAVVTIEETVQLESDQSCYGRVPSGLQRRAASGTGVGRFFATMAELEAAAVTAFEQLTAELVAHGAPRSLVREARRARHDEIRHARAAARLAHRYGGSPTRPRVSPWTPRALVDVATDNVAEGCIRESYGALVATVQARRARDPIVRRVLASIAVDETRHAALSWELARWAETRLGPVERRRVAAHGRDALERLERELTGSHAEVVHRVAGMPHAAEAKRLFTALRPDLLA